MPNQRRYRASLLLLIAMAVVPLRAHAQVQVTVRTLYAPEAIYISNLAPSNNSQPTDLFDVTLVAPPGTAEAAQMTLSVSRERPNPAEIFSGTTNTFTLQAGARHLTSGDLFSSGRDVSITEYTIAGEAERLRDQVGHTGRLPAGTYVFALEVRRPTGVLLGSGQARLEIANPTGLTLLAPGVLTGMTPPIVNPTALRFIWSPDGSSSGAFYNLRVVKTDGAQSGEEAMQGQVSWETNTGATSELYPASAAALRLEPGATYAWQVTREVRSSGGSELIRSPIYWFKVENTGERTSVASGEDSFATRLTELLKGLGLGSEIAQFKPVSAQLSDGRTITLQSLEEVLAAIAAGDLSLVSVRIR
ncbi:MAG: hypothetical protein ACT4O1_14625 [Gemmatimonadota bacterium]